MNRIVYISLLACVMGSSCKGKKTETAQPVTAPVTEAVFAPGHLEAANQFTLTALNDGYITEVPVQEGDRVTTGQVVIKQDNTTAQIQAQTATENLRLTQEQAADHSAAMRQLEAQLLSARQKLQNDQVQLERMTRLFATHSVAKTDVDNAQLAYDNSVNSVNNLQQNIAATRLTLQQSVVNSRGQQQTAVANAGYYAIKSPGAYTVYSLLKRKGDLVRKGDALAVLGNGDALTILLNIDEASIAKIQLQQKVLVELNTQKGTTYTAHVSRIYPAFDEASQSYKTEALFDTIPPGAINGTLLQANIIVAHKDKTLLIPRSCLSPDGKVIVQRRGGKDTIAVQTGIVSTDWVEVLQGVSVTDQLIKAW